MFEQILADNGTKFAVAAVVVLLGLLCLALVLWIVRGRPSSPFIRGGRNRTPRLAVLDAAAIDTRRRLVLLRRDDVEHLVMIGGPTDIVIETRIVGASPATVVAEAQPAAADAPPARPPAAARTAARTTPRPVQAPETVSGMGKVLYAGDETEASHPSRIPAPAPAQAPTRPQPVSGPPPAQSAPREAVQPPPATTSARPPADPLRPGASMPERRAEAMLEEARQRVLPTAPAPQAASPRPAPPHASAAAATAPQAAITNPAASAADNPALVSEFEKMLEAEMEAAAPRLTPQQIQATALGAANAANSQPDARTREETEAEMARLLGEIAVNRKS